MALTTRGLASIKPGKWKTDEAKKGEGRLVAYGLKEGGSTFYFRYTLPSGRRDSLPLGRYDPAGREGLTLQQASDKAAELSLRYRGGARDLRVILEAERREAERIRREADEADASAAMRKRATLGALLDAYVAQLERGGKTSAPSVKNTLHLHVKEPWPKLWEKPVAETTMDDLLNIVSKLVQEGKKRQAGLVRSYLSAAFASGIRARQDPKALPVLRNLNVASNPARDLVTIDGTGNARERALSIAELRAYWKRIKKLQEPYGALLRFHLLTGGQRVEQLRRLAVDDHDKDLQIVRVRDPKGRRKVARDHYVPLIPAAVEALEIMQNPTRAHVGGGANEHQTTPSNTNGAYLFTVTAGESGAVYSTLENAIHRVIAAMQEAGELEKGSFTAGDLRRTVETRLSALRVSKEHRAQLQSHGLSGVQSRHYDKHDYLDEKRAALELLYGLLTGEAGKVVSIKQKVA